MGLLFILLVGVFLIYLRRVFHSGMKETQALHSTQSQQLYRPQKKINETEGKIEGQESLDDQIKGYKIQVTPDIRTSLSVLKLRDKQFITEGEAENHDFEAHEGIVMPVLMSFKELGFDIEEPDPGTTWTDIGHMYPKERDKYYSFLEQFRRVIENESLSPPKRVALVQSLPDSDNFLVQLKQKYGENFPENVFIGRLSKIDGISDSIGKILYDKRIYDKNDLKRLNFDELIKIKGVGEKRAEQIVNATSAVPDSVDKNASLKNNRSRIYNPQEVQNAANQILETTQIMAISKNIDTISGRAEFLDERIQHLKGSFHEGRYRTDIQMAIDHYKSTFYNTQIHDWQLKSILEPHGFDHHHFSARCLLNGFKRHCEDQFKQINNLKRDNAIRNRYKKLNETFEEFLDEFDIEWHSADANKFKMDSFPEIKKLSDMIKSELKTEQ
ncbi:MAG: helix-hairpin-helix domain-containing protein [Balneolaceae bacterium]